MRIVFYAWFWKNLLKCNFLSGAVVTTPFTSSSGVSNTPINPPPPAYTTFRPYSLPSMLCVCPSIPIILIKNHFPNFGRILPSILIWDPGKDYTRDYSNDIMGKKCIYLYFLGEGTSEQCVRSVALILSFIHKFMSQSPWTVEMRLFPARLSSIKLL